MSGWTRFWDGSHAIYVNDRHRDLHYRDIARAIAAFVPHANARVLDYGSGEALHADLVAGKAVELLLCDSAPSVRANLSTRFAGNPKIRVLAVEDVARLGAGSLDLIVVNSVIQYLTPAECDALFALARRLTAPGGALLVADVIPPDVGLVTDALALLRYAAANGFLLASVAGLVRTAFSRYGRLRATLKISRYKEAEFAAKAAAAGFAAERLERNVGHNAARMTFLCRPK